MTYIIIEACMLGLVACVAGILLVLFTYAKCYEEGE